MSEDVDGLKKKNERLIASVKNLLLIIDNGIPEPSHEGVCGPWAACDWNCEARAYCSEYIEEARSLVVEVDG